MLGGGPEQAALIFGNVELKFQNMQKSQCGHVELKIMNKHTKLMTKGKRECETRQELIHDGVVCVCERYHFPQ